MLLKHGGAAVVFAVLLAACATQPAYKISDVTEARALSDHAFDMFAEGDNEGAIKALNAVIAYGTIDDADYARRAAVYGTLKDYDKALMDADRSIALAPRAWRRYLERAVLLQRVGRYHDAIADLDHAIGLKPTEVEPLRRRAYLKVVAARFDDAIQDYDDLSAMLPNSDTGALGRGAALYLSGRWREAAGQFSAMLENKPHDGLAALWLAKARARAGQFMGWDEVEHNAGPEPEWLMTRMLLTAEPHIDAAAPLANVDGCERAVFMGVWRLVRHAGDGAAKAFSAAESACPPDSIEASEARSEIARLKKN
jgi:tetratricopeptide (TPR) repeat protein